MISIEEKDIIPFLFNKPFMCEANLMSLQLLCDEVTTEDLHTPLSLDNALCVGITVTHYPGALALIANSLSGYSRMLDDPYTDKDSLPYYKEQVQLTVDKIAEIVYRLGEVTIMVVSDAIVIYEHLVKYFEVIEQAKIYRPHYNPPPADDLAAFAKLKEMLEPLWSAVKRERNGVASNNDLRAAFGKYGVNLPEDIEPVSLKLDGDKELTALSSGYNNAQLQKVRNNTYVI